MKFFIEYFFSKCEEINEEIIYWRNLMENFVFCAVFVRRIDSFKQKIWLYFSFKLRFYAG